jgi:hypothetical protein
MRLKYLIIAGVCLALWALTGPTGFTDSDHQERGRETLVGLHGIGLHVKELSWEVERDGLTRAQIQRDVELKLRIAGINIVHRTEEWADPRVPGLYINVSTYKTSDMPLYAFSISIEFRQVVLLNTIPPDDIGVVAITWIDGMVGAVGSKNVNLIRYSIKELVDVFINDYLRMNPKK